MSLQTARRQFIAFSFGVFTTVGSGMTLNSWVACIQVANSTCMLDAGNYTGSELSPYVPLTVANGVTATGGGTNEYSTSLQRPSGYMGNIMYVAAGASVTISNMTFDGNRDSFANASTGCGQTATSPCGPSTGYGCTPANFSVDDVLVAGYAFIDTVAFWKAPDTSVRLNAGYLYYVSVFYARSTGAVFDSGGSGSTVSNSYFQYNGTAGLKLSGPGGTFVYHTTFRQNRYEMPDGSGGGQLYIDYGATNNIVERNLIDGDDWQTPSTNINGCYPPATAQGVTGIEVEPGSGSTSLQANEIKNNTNSGIIAHSVSSLYISGYDRDSNIAQYIHDNTGSPGGFASNGILIQTTSYGASTGVTLDGILSRFNEGYAVLLDSGTSGPGWLGNHCLGSNNISSPYQITSSNNMTTTSPSNISTCP